jgi:predicted DNA-binding protein
MSSLTKQLTFRLPRELYAEAAAIAKRRKTSVNALVREGLEAVTRDERQARLREAFEHLAKHGDTDVEYAIHAASEVILGDE